MHPYIVIHLHRSGLFSTHRDLPVSSSSAEMKSVCHYTQPKIVYIFKSQ